MSKINIPERLAARLSHEDKERTWLAPVLQFTANIESILAKDPDFFPDYTLHGVPHLNRVLELASQLISTDTLSEKPLPDKKDLLTPRDVAFLVCGILLHDMGMYLRPDGLKKLIKQKKTEDAFGGKPWNQEWSEYVDRTKRLSQEKMRYHFGRVIPVTEDCVDHADTDDNKRIIGEFLRQHHARLAHEFAIGVLPGSTDTDLFANTIFDEDDRMMIGLLARSHGMAIRDTEEYLKTKFDNTVKPYNLPVFYLMAVLRIADYLDADGQRAPKQLTQQQKISVPLSAEEWTWNQCINAYATHFDFIPKNYYVSAKPKTSPQYVQLEKWLKSVQTDLDLCWSILAEKYPDDKNRYRLSIHRVVSNIHQPDHVKELNNTFLTKEAKISANPEIIKLMMAPLYGNEPTYGVRELLQNAVDACLEREQWEKTHKDGDPNYKGLVDIRIENDIFTITDNGMGMNENVLLNYYLSAGSSYRSSDAWMAANAPDGKSQVARTGKFGVGFLAAFLLGDEIEVHTQHREDNQGYSFTFSQESTVLDVRRKERAEPGTTITIRLKPTAIKKWDKDPKWYNWYAFDDPVVSYTFNGKPVEYRNLRLHRTPTEDDGWLKLPSDDFEAYHWKPTLTSSQPKFYCNGIRIYHRFPDSMVGSSLRIYYPHISILDKQGKLAVDLARKELEEIPLEETLLREVLRWHIARLLLTPWNSEEDHRQNLLLGFTLFDNDGFGHIPFLLASGGFQLNHASLLRPLSIRDYVVLYHEGPDARDACLSARNFLLKDKPCTIVAADVCKQRTSGNYYAQKLYYDTPSAFTNDLLSNASGLLNMWIISYSVNEHTRSLWFRPDIPDKMDEEHQERITLDEPSTIAHLLTGYYDDKESIMPIDPERFPAEQFPAAFHVVPDFQDYDFSTWNIPRFVRMMKELLTPEPGWPQDLWIPYDMEDRKQKFRRAFHELSDYIEHIQKEPEREALRKAEMVKQEARRKAEMAKQEAEIAALIALQEAEKARQEEQRMARFQTFRATYLPDITAFLDQAKQAAPDDLPHLRSAFLAKFVAAHYLKRPMDSIPQEALQEPTELSLSALDLGDLDLSPEGFPTTPDELAEELFASFDGEDMDTLRKGAEADDEAALLLETLSRLQQNLPEA